MIEVNYSHLRWLHFRTAYECASLGVGIPKKFEKLKYLLNLVSRV